MKRRSHLVFNHTDTAPVACGLFAFFETPKPPHLQAQGRVAFQGPPTGRHVLAPVDRTGDLADLINKEKARLALVEDGDEFAEGVADDAGLQAVIGVCKGAVDLGLGNESRERIHDDQGDHPAPA